MVYHATRTSSLSSLLRPETLSLSSVHEDVEGEHTLPHHALLDDKDPAYRTGKAIPGAIDEMPMPLCARQSDRGNE